MTSVDPAEDLVPCMRSVQLSDGDKQLMSAFKNKVDGETESYLHSEADPRYKGGHIPSRTFRILQAATGGPDGVSGGAPPSGARIGGPGQNRTVVVTMPAGGASGPPVHPSQQEVPEPRKYTGGNIPSRSFRVLQQMTADDQGSAALQRPVDGPPRRSPSHYAHGPEAAAHPTPTPRPAGVPTCERIEQERQQQQRAAANGRYAGGKIPSRAFQQLNGDYPAEGDRPDGKEAVLDELRAVGAGQAPRPARPAAVPSRSFRLLQQEYGSQEQEQEARSAPEQEQVVRSTPEQQKQRLAATSRTYRMLQVDPTAVPSVFGRNRR